MEKMRETAPTEAVGCTIDAGQDGKTEILVYCGKAKVPPGGAENGSRK
jgi:hypothetical protein